MRRDASGIVHPSDEVDIASGIDTDGGSLPPTVGPNRGWPYASDPTRYGYIALLLLP